MSWPDQVAEAIHWHQIKPWVTGAILALGGFSFLGKPSSPSIIIADKGGRLGVIEAAQFKTNLDEPLPGYFAWARPEEKAKEKEEQAHGPTLAEFRRVLRLDDHDHSCRAPGGFNWIERSPTRVAQDMSSNFVRHSTADKAREASIWKNDTRKALVTPIPLPAKSSGNSPTLHIARIPPRVAKPKSIGHVKPNADREAVWLRSISIPPSAGVKPNDSSSGRARVLDAEDYLVGWLFVITKCGYQGGCKIGLPGEAACVTPETLTDHVLGMTHVVLPRTYLYGLSDDDAKQKAETLATDILNGGGLVLLTGADYDYVSLRVSHYPRAVGKPSDVAEVTDSSADKPSQTKECSIAELDERLHEILARMNRDGERSVDDQDEANRVRNDLNDGDLVAILPTALDLKLNPEDYLIVGIDEVPPPLRSHYRSSPDIVDPSTVEAGRVDIHIRVDWSETQGRRPAVRMSAAVDE